MKTMDWGLQSWKWKVRPYLFEERISKDDILPIVWVEKGVKLGRRYSIRPQMVMKNGGCDAKSLYKYTFIAHHEISLAFENMFEILVGRYIITAN
jgi:hypothetical protein